MNLNQYKNFEVNIYGDVTPYNETISKARVRIFYRGLNRNGSYINDNFAEKLIASLPYAPVKGIYSTIDGDYTDHGTERTQGRAYGVVMGPNEIDFAWEQHIDEDGVQREYACANVLLWTSLYEEAKQIPGKSQSMELYEPSIQGYIRNMNGKRIFEFTDACFLGLQALGNDVEPCFEGSSFFSLYNKLFEGYAPDDKGEKSMNDNFRLSANEKTQQVWQKLNPYNAEQQLWEVNYGITEVYDDCIIAFEYESNKYIKINYSIENNDIVLGDRIDVYVDYLTCAERKEMDEKRKKDEEELETMKKKCGGCELKIEELNNTISTLQTEKENFELQFNQVSSELAANNAAMEEYKNAKEAELDSLLQFKLDTELKEKKAIIADYADKLSMSSIESFSANINDYDAASLEKELAFELVKSNPSIFTKTVQLLPKDEPLTGIEAILAKYQK